MNTMKDFGIHDDVQKEFKSKFGELAAVYWQIYRDRQFYDFKVTEIEEKYNYSTSSVVRITKKVANFFKDPKQKNEKTEYGLHDLTGGIYFPNAFDEAYDRLSLASCKVFIETIYLYQHGLPHRIPRAHILQYSNQYKNMSRRSKMFDELRELQVALPNDRRIKIYQNIVDEKGAMRFQFTKDALIYIDPWLWLKLVFLNNMYQIIDKTKICTK